MIDDALYWDKEAFTKHLTAFFPAALYWKNAQSVFLGCNAAFAELVGLQAPQEIAGLTDYNLPRGKIFQNPDLVPDNQIILNEEIFMLNSSPYLFMGKTRYFNIRKIPLFDKQRHVFGLLGIYNDVTRIERLKARLKKQKIKRKAAETTNRAKSEFLQNMRHDVRTPLTGILGFAHIIKEIAETEEMQEYADSIAVSANALLNLMNDVLDAGKVNSDELPIVHKKFDLRYTLQQALDLYLVKADYKRLQLKLDYDANLPRYVMGDPVRIHRIALELISNGIKFTSAGFVHISASLVSRKKRHLIVNIAVRDSGTGIRLDKRDDIFLKFKRLTPSYEGIINGTGLGLAVVKKFIEEIGGEISFDDQISSGTKINCLLPLTAALIDDASGVENREFKRLYKLYQKKFAYTHPNAHTKPAHTLCHVLLIEDQDLAAIAARTLLSKLACQVDLAKSGKSTMQLIQENRYDIIFIDIGLPDTNGYELTRQIREYEIDKHLSPTPLAALSAHIDKLHLKRCIKAGMNFVLSKPLRKTEAIHILSEVIPHWQERYEKIKRTAPPLSPLKLQEKSPAYYRDRRELVDFELAKHILECGELYVWEMLHLFIQTFPDDLNHLRAAYTHKHWKHIIHIAHQIRGSASYCGCTRLQDACTQFIEARSNKKEPNKMPALYEALITEMESLQEYVRAESF